MLRKYGWLVLIIGLALAFWLGKQSTSDDPMAQAPKAASTQTSIRNLPETIPMPSGNANSATTELPGYLPPEAKSTLDLIASNGPFPNHQDGVVFQNREQRLPKKARGYYHEYTVETPGLSHRGARRIITGGTPIQIYYYTDDHYDSFREFKVQP